MDNRECLLDRRLSVGGHTYVLTVDGAGGVRLLGTDSNGEVVSEVAGTVLPEDLPTVSDFLASTFAGWAAMTCAPAAPRTGSLALKRQVHQNLGARWTENDERRLVARHREGATIKDLMGEFGRTRGGIVSRLVRLGALTPDRWPPTLDAAGQDAA